MYSVIHVIFYVLSVFLPALTVILHSGHGYVNCSAGSTLAMVFILHYCQVIYNRLVWWQISEKMKRKNILTVSSQLLVTTRTPW